MHPSGSCQMNYHRRRMYGHIVDGWGKVICWSVEWGAGDEVHRNVVYGMMFTRLHMIWSDMGRNETSASSHHPVSQSANSWNLLKAIISIIWTRNKNLQRKLPNVDQDFNMGFRQQLVRCHLYIMLKRTSFSFLMLLGTSEFRINYLAAFHQHLKRKMNRLVYALLKKDANGIKL